MDKILNPALFLFITLLNKDPGLLILSHFFSEFSAKKLPYPLFKKPSWQKL